MHATCPYRCARTGLLTSRRFQLHQAIPNVATVPLIRCSRMRGRHHRWYSPASARSAEASGSQWPTVIPHLVQDLKGQDPAAQSEAAWSISLLCFDPAEFKTLTPDLVAAGVVPALSQALSSKNWDVIGNVILCLGLLALSSPRLAASIPAKTTVPVLVEILRGVDSISDMLWFELPDVKNSTNLPYRADIQGAVASILGAVADNRVPGAAAAVDAVPLLVPLLDVQDKENRLRISTARALGELAGYDSTLADAVMQSGTTAVLTGMLYDSDDNVVIAAAEALGKIALTGKKARDMMEENGSFDRLMSEAASSARRNKAFMKAIIPWGIERLRRELPKY